MEKRDSNGRFKRGHSRHSKKSYWDSGWLRRQYCDRGKSAAQIAGENGCTENNILYYLAKHGITRRSMSEIRKNKWWGSVGEKNPMYGRRGRLNPRWDGGKSPERQSLYAQHEWKKLSASIKRRDKNKCTECGASGVPMHVHHIKRWSRYPELRFEPTNLRTVCIPCHKKIHAKKG